MYRKYIFIILVLIITSNNIYAWSQCGGEGSSFSQYIPDAEKITDGKYGEKYVRWGSACAKHDSCYEHQAPKFKNNPKGNRSKKARERCDKQFRRDFKSRCSAQLQSKSGLYECFRNALYYYKAVRAFGGGPWRKSMHINSNNERSHNSSNNRVKNKTTVILSERNINGHQVMIYVAKNNKAYIRVDGRRTEMTRNGRFRSNARILSLLPRDIRNNRLVRRKITSAKIQWRNNKR